MDLKDKEYFSVAGETESSAPKSIYSFAQIFLLSLEVKLLPRATAILANGFLLPGNKSGLDDILGGVLSLPKPCNQEVSRSFTLQSCKLTAKKYTKKVCYTSCFFAN